VEKIEPFAKRNKVTFPLLSDVGSKTIDAYHIRSTDAPPGTERVCPSRHLYRRPKGVIRAKLFRLSYRERPAVDA
jgi:peroxiredoxin